MTPTQDMQQMQRPEDHGVRRRTRMREFQSQLVERMQAARSGAQSHVNQLGIQIGNSRWLVRLQDAGEIVPVGAITAVPLTQDWFLGVTSIRGKLVSVTDLARFHGEPATPIDRDSRILAFAPALGFNGGLLVSRVLGLRNMSLMQESAAAAGADLSWSSGCYLDDENQSWNQLELALAIQDARFLHVGI
ncbi:chemotaxis protein CheW [Lacisediminimonas sp.]|uniref:chemotaxis protein CheW n=1 Tax=Lacisediminimonas sp. TaxID=3060582 RepID=UPI00271E2E8D|nr:chemotaxis protein CheW [Lacisediminimonas sp.]MDO8300612.1 chemotaxis protein CheW [Lacisediminimonas sp.]